MEDLEQEVIGEDFIPAQAIIVYRQKNKYDKDFYLESRNIEHTPKGYQMAEGTPLSKHALSQIMDAVNSEDVEKMGCKSIFPKNLLYYNIKNLEPHIVWYVESQSHHLVFDDNLSITNGMCHLPTLVFRLRGKDLDVFAVKTNNPDANTKLFKAPFHNVYNNGNICMGSAKAKKSNDIIKLMSNYEKAFFSSKFTHLHSSGSPIDGNLNTYLNALIKTKGKFDKSVLIPIKHTIKELV